MKIVVNRYVKKGWDSDPEEVERALGLKISWMVPNDFKTAIEAINFGEPVVIRNPRAEISTSLTGLAQMLNAKASAVAAETDQTPVQGHRQSGQDVEGTELGLFSAHSTGAAGRVGPAPSPLRSPH